MISLVASMLRTRPAQAIGVLVLSALATAAAVAGPVTLAAIDAAVVRNQVARASVADLSVSTRSATDPSDPSAADQFTTLTHLLALPGFTVLRGGELTAFPIVAPGQSPAATAIARVVFRDDACAHIVITAGRCVAGTHEVLLGEDAAAAAGLRAGDAAVAQAARYDAVLRREVPDGPPTPVTVVGLYHPRDPDERYWGVQGYFPATPAGKRSTPVLVNAPTFDLIGHAHGASTAESLIGASDLTPDRLAGVKADVIAALGRSQGGGSIGFAVNTTIPEFVDRVDAERALAHQLVPVAFVPLVGLCWFVIALTVGHGVTGRRFELGLVSLRGVGRARRWWLATGETVLSVLAGAPLGYLLGYALVAAFARLRFGGAEGVAPSAAALAYAVLAVAGALAVALLGQSRVLASGVLDLLRGVPGRPAPWRSLAIDVTLVVVAAAGVVQVRGQSNGLTGVEPVLPGLVIATVSGLAARLCVPVAAAAGRAALRRGRLGAGLAALQLARRPGSQRLFILITAALGLLAFTAAGNAAATRERADQTATVLGAPMVATINQSTVDRLLVATRRADPAGTWAMAAIPVAQRDRTLPPVLAVDAARLPAVASWRPDYGLTAQAAAAALAPVPAQSLELRDGGFTADVERTGPASDTPATVAFAFESLTDGSIDLAPIQVPDGRGRYSAVIPGCAGGCRLTGFTIDGGAGAPVTLILHDLTVLSRPIAVARWRGSAETTVAIEAGGLRIATHPNPFSPAAASVTVLDAPLPVAAVSTRPDLATLTGLDGAEIDARVAAPAAELPRLAGTGTLVDLITLRRVGLRTSGGAGGEVWLSAQAPADALARLRAAGLAIDSVRDAAAEEAYLSRSGPALAMQSQLVAAGLGVLLAAGGLALLAAIDRRRRAGDLRALRQQGLARRFVRRAAGGAYLTLVLLAALAGLGAAAAAWYLTGDAVLGFGTGTSELAAVALPWGGAALVLLTIAGAAGWLLQQAVRSPARGKGR